MLRSTHGGWARRRRALVVSLAAALGAATLTTSAPAAAAPLQTPAPAEPVDVSSSLTAANPAVTTFTGERFADTRPGGATIDGTFLGAGPRPAGTDYEVQIAGRGSVPAGADSVVINLTALAPAAKGYFTAYECAPALPIASGLNFAPGIDVANEIVVKLSAIGTLCVFNSAEAGVLIDVVGFISATDSVKTMTQKRFAESRVGAPTFDGQFQGFGRTAPGSITPIKIAGRDGVPPTFSAVIANVAVVDPASDGFVTVYGCLPTVPTASSINHTAGVNIANELIVQPDANGEICVFTQKDIDLIVDVVGYVETGSDLVSTSNTRYFESRSGATTFDGQSQGGGILAAGSTAMVQIGGRGAVPSDAATAVVNVAAVDPADNGFFTVYPCSDPQPNSSSLNYTTGVNGANELIADLDATGKLCVFTSASAHLLVDVVGYVNPNADLSITKSDSVDPVAAGTALTFTIEVANSGAHTATDVVVTDTLPAEATLVSTAGCAEDPAGVPTCTLGDIAAGASKSFTVQTTVALGTSGTITNTAAVDSSTGDPNAANNAASENTDVFQVGTITVVKDFVGTAGLVNLGIDMVPQVTDVGDGGTTGAVTVETGNHSASEAAGTGTDLNDYNTTYSCLEDSNAASPVAGSATSTTNIPVEEGDAWTCTFTNTRKTGTIEVVKDFVGTAGLVDLSVDASVEAVSQGDGGTTGPVSVDTGNHTASEAASAGTDLGDYGVVYSCVEDTNTASPVNGAGATTGSIPVEDGDAWTCTFTNTRNSGTITVVKDFVGTAGLVDLSVDATVEASDQGDGGTTGPVSAETGNHTASEAAGTGTDLNDYNTTHSCTEDTNGASPINGTGPTSANIPVETGDAWTCTFTNTRKTGTITVVKDFVGTAGLVNLGIDMVPQATNVGDGGTTGAVTVDTGNHFTSEAAGTGTDLNDYNTTHSCTEDTNGASPINGTGTSTANIPVEEGDAWTCTFTNTRKTGTIEVVKELLPAGDPGLFNLQIDGSTAGGATDVGDTGTTGAITVDTGNHTAGETAGTGTVLGAYSTTHSCVEDTNAASPVAGAGVTTANIPVEEGDVWTCTITNNAEAAPTVTTVSPANTATQVATDTNVVVTFSEAVTLSNDWATLVCGATTYNITGAGGATVLGVTDADPVFTLNPPTDLPTGTLCTLTVDKDEVADDDANDPPDNMAADFVSTFTTDSAPAVSSTTPADGASNVAVTSNVIITFTEGVGVTGDWVEIVCTSSGTYNPTGSGGATLIAVTDADPIYTLNPAADFSLSESCTVTVDRTLVTDDDTADPPDNMLADHVFTFTTPDTAPAVSSIVPADNAGGVGPAANVVVTFNEPVTVTGDWVTIVCGATTYNVTGAGGATVLAVTDADPVYTLNPAVDFPGGATCNVTVVATLVTDDDTADPPDNMAANFTSSFTIAPLALADAYNSTGNVGISVPDGATDLLGNDQGTGLTVDQVQGSAANVGVATDTTAAGLGGVKGSVTVAANGSFTYTPPPGFTGADTFTYRNKDASSNSNTVTVTITVADMIWFIDSASAATGDNGTLDNPYKTLAAFDTANTGAAPAPQPGQSIFLATGTGDYTGGVGLRNSQTLVGQGAGDTIANITGITPAANSKTLPTTGGTDPVIADGAGNGIDLASANTVRGLNIGTTSGTGLNGTAVGALAVSEVAILGTGGGVDISNGATISVALDSLTSTGGDGIRVQSTAGPATFTVTGMADINTAAGDAIDIDGSPGVTFNFGSIDIDGGTANGIDINAGAGFNVTGTTTIDGVTGDGIEVTSTGAPDNYDFGSTTIGGSSAPGGAGVDITGSGGATFTFDALSATTTSGAGLSANNGGTITVNGSANAITTTTGVGVNIVDTTIGGGGPTVSGTDLTGAFGMTFRSVSVGTGAAGPANAVMLDNAGSGGFLITGTGSTDASGGTIQDTTGDAFVVRDGTQNVEVNNVDVDDGGRHGVFGLDATNLVFRNTTFDNVGNAADENVFSFSTETAGAGNDNNVDGILTLDDVDVTAFHESGIHVYADNGTLTANVINGSSFNNNDDAAGKRFGVYFELAGSATAALTVSDSSFDDVESDAVRFEAGSSGNNSVSILNNSSTDGGGPNNFPNGGGISIIGDGGGGNLLFDVRGNVLENLPGDPIIVSSVTPTGGTATDLEGRIGGPLVADGNQMWNDPASILGDGISLTANDAEASGLTVTALIQNNFVGQNSTGSVTTGMGDDGIFVLAGDNNGVYNVTIEDNTIRSVAPQGEGIDLFLDEDGNNAVPAPTVNARIVDNNIISVGPSEQAIEFETFEIMVACVHMTGNENGSGGALPGVIEVSQAGTSTLQITQASTAALSTANAGSTVSAAGTITFNGSCTNPALPVIP